MLTLVLTATILINFIESKYLLVETENNKDDGGADYRSDPHADLGWSDGRGHDGCVARCFGLEIQFRRKMPM